MNKLDHTVIQIDSDNIHNEDLKESPVDPFADNLHLTLKHKLRIVFMTVTIVPIRIFMVLLTIFIGWLWALVITIGMSTTEPAGPFRRKLFNGWRRILRAIYFFMGFHKIEVVGKRAKAEEAPILIIGPHSSMMDMFLFSLSGPIPSGVSAMKNKTVPFLGTMSKVVQPLFVIRQEAESKKKIAQEIQRRVSNPTEWPQTVIYPEGTTTNRKALITFKSGGFAPGVPVQPAIIEYLNDYDSFSWSVQHAGTWTIMWLSLCQFSIKAKITYLPVYHPSEDERNDSKLYANNVRKVMADFTNLPSTEHSFEDVRLMGRAENLGLPLNTGRIEYTKLAQRFGINYKNMREKLVEFSKLANKEGLLSLADIERNTKFNSYLQNWFLKNNCNGFINFRIYLIGLCLAQEKHDENANLKLTNLIVSHNEVPNKEKVSCIF